MGISGKSERALLIPPLTAARQREQCKRTAHCALCTAPVAAVATPHAAVYTALAFARAAQGAEDLCCRVTGALAVAAAARANGRRRPRTGRRVCTRHGRWHGRPPLQQARRARCAGRRRDLHGVHGADGTHGPRRRAPAVAAVRRRNGRARTLLSTAPSAAHWEGVQRRRAAAQRVPQATPYVEFVPLYAHSNPQLPRVRLGKC